jgi:hypothetical protein
MMPPAAAYLAAFGATLRRNGFAANSDQTTLFLASLPLLGPGGIDDLRQAALACYGPFPERRGEFDALFRAHFYGDALAVGSAETLEEKLAENGAAAPERADDEQSGDSASASERLQERLFPGRAADDALRRLGALLPERLPRRKAFRQRVSSRGQTIDLRRSLRQITRNDGDILHPEMTVRSVKPRNLVILIDVSGSMKTATDEYLRLAHLVAQRAAGVEVFTFATRLSRITPALRLRDPAAALAAASARVADWDGGTRIGPCLAEFLSVPRYASFARGAAVLVISDGIERGDASDFVKTVWRLSRLAWRLSWATPLAADPRFEPRTRALRAVLPALDDLVDGSSLAALAEFLLTLAAPGVRPEEVWTAEGRRRPPR